jgi:hypothetical protein
MVIFQCEDSVCDVTEGRLATYVCASSRSPPWPGYLFLGGIGYIWARYKAAIVFLLVNIVS